MENKKLAEFLQKLKQAPIESEKGKKAAVPSADDADGLREALRRERKRVCFPIVDRGQCWYSTLSPAQRAQLLAWYHAWLNAPQTLKAPEPPEWMKTEAASAKE